MKLIKLFPVALALLLFSGCEDSGTPTISVSSSQLYADYRANEVAADAKYKGKILDISGTVTGIGNDILDNGYVTLYGDGFLSVQCSFKNKAQLAPVHQGQQVRIKGMCDGLMGNVLIEKCEFE